MKVIEIESGITKHYHVKFETMLDVVAESKQKAQEKAASIMNSVADRFLGTDLVDDECELISCEEKPDRTP